MGGGVSTAGGGGDHSGGTRDGTGVMIMSLEAHTRRGFLNFTGREAGILQGTRAESVKV